MKILNFTFALMLCSALFTACNDDKKGGNTNELENKGGQATGDNTDSTDNTSDPSKNDGGNDDSGDDSSGNNNDDDNNNTGAPTSVSCTEGFAFLENTCGWPATPASYITECQADAGYQCYVSCYVDSGCSTLAEIICAGWNENNPAHQRFADCLAYCETQPGSTDEFTCTNGEKIPANWECDGDVDCADGSDEHASCTTSTAPTFVCADGETIPAEFECDIYEDCADGSDEHQNCPADIGFDCGGGNIIPADWECDGEVDCANGSDEHANCPPTLEEAICQ